ncbi:hypothetical protein Pme01_33870 [Planosporangium mesophilum]|uniref:Uncharacterized protein n=1 Tax=Planosporangium mesophilum TaxID=689768 RepID=A0A8J3TM05_9ACTN|nr:hypothetical protein Pme01_33870 [Planosporangium mesophilum]
MEYVDVSSAHSPLIETPGRAARYRLTSITGMEGTVPARGRFGVAVMAGGSGAAVMAGGSGAAVMAGGSGAAVVADGRAEPDG